VTDLTRPRRVPHSPLPDRVRDPRTRGVDFHRTISTYLNQLIRPGCQLAEVAEPGLSVEAAEKGPEGIDSYVFLPKFLIVAARKPV
jgi:hypothetical protein